jgi:hypothetical protein
MARGVSQRDHAAERGAEHDRIGDAEGIAECAYVVAPLLQVPAFARTILASAIASMIEIDDLRDIGQGRVGGLVDRMVEAGAAVEEQQCRFFPHDRTIWDELRALDIEEQPHPVDEHMHGLSPSL